MVCSGYNDNVGINNSVCISNVLRKEFCFQDHFEKIKLIVYLFVMVACHNVAFNNGIVVVEIGSQ